MTYENGATHPARRFSHSGFVPLTCHYGRHPRDTPGRSDHETRKEPSTSPMSSNSSQADSAGSIPVTRSTHEKRCSRIELENSSPPPICVSVPCSGHCGPQISTPRDSPSNFRRRSACSVMFPGCPVLRFFQRRLGESPRIRARVNGLNYRSHARAGALDTEVPVRSASWPRRVRSGP